MQIIIDVPDIDRSSVPEINELRIGDSLFVARKIGEKVFSLFWHSECRGIVTIKN